VLRSIERSKPHTSNEAWRGMWDCPGCPGRRQTPPLMANAPCAFAMSWACVLLGCVCGCLVCVCVQGGNRKRPHDENTCGRGLVFPASTPPTSLPLLLLPFSAHPHSLNMTPTPIRHRQGHLPPFYALEGRHPDPFVALCHFRFQTSQDTPTPAARTPAPARQTLATSLCNGRPAAAVPEPPPHGGGLD